MQPNMESRTLLQNVASVDLERNGQFVTTDEDESPSTHMLDSQRGRRSEYAARLAHVRLVAVGALVIGMILMAASLEFASTNNEQTATESTTDERVLQLWDSKSVEKLWNSDWLGHAAQAASDLANRTSSWQTDVLVNAGAEAVDFANKTGSEFEHKISKMSFDEQMRAGWDFVAGLANETNTSKLDNQRLEQQLRNAGLWGSNKLGSLTDKTDQLRDEIRDFTKQGCTSLDGLYFTKVIHSNLGGGGPDFGEQSLVLESNHTQGGLKVNKLDFKVTANTVYVPSLPSFNGLSDGLDTKYGTIVVRPGTSVNLTFRIHDPDTGKPIRMSSVSYTFFDLDEGILHSEREFIKARDFSNVELAKNTEVERVQHLDGSTTFQATTKGTFQDNPVDPLLLTQQQKNRAVTLTYKDAAEVSVVIGSSGGGTSPARAFQFVAHPVLECAKTVGKVKDVATGEEAMKPLIYGAALLLLLVLGLLCCCCCC